MNTKIFKIEDPAQNTQALTEAASILRSGGIVAFPTETVYGLGGNALDPAAAAKIFRAKGRPQDNPLIVHISALSELEVLCHDVPDEAYALASAYWPGPLTMILPKNECIPDETTAGLDTAGIRMPSHPVARALIAACGVPIAAPSANLSGKPSTTSFAHVLRDMDGRVDAIIDGGTSEVGLESTVIEFDSGFARILRPGYITKEDIEAVLGEGKCLIAPGVREHVADNERVRSPGMKYRHYAPQAPVLAVCGKTSDVAREIRRRTRGQTGCAAIVCDEYAHSLPCETIPCGKSDDVRAMAHKLFDALRTLDRPDVIKIYAQCPEETGIGLAVANRLKRAAAFRVVQARRLCVVGLTGPTGAGKSTVCDFFREKGARILDCDALYHKMLDTDEALLSAIRASFPDAFPDGKLDRKALGKIVFADSEALALLNKTVLPIVALRVEKEIDKAEEEGEAMLVLDAPTLFESGLDRTCDLTVGVLAAKDTRIARIAARDGLSEEYARLRVEGGKGDAYYRARCAEIVTNDGDPAALAIQMDRINHTINIGR